MCIRDRVDAATARSAWSCCCPSTTPPCAGPRTVGGDPEHRSRRMKQMTPGSTGDRLDILTIGRTGVDIYPLQIARRLEDVSTFGKFLGGSATNVAVAARGRRRHTVLDLDYRSTLWPAPVAAREQILRVLEQFTVVVGNREECEVCLLYTSPSPRDGLLSRM